MHTPPPLRMRAQAGIVPGIVATASRRKVWNRRLRNLLILSSGAADLERTMARHRSSASQRAVGGAKPHPSNDCDFSYDKDCDNDWQKEFHHTDVLDWVPSPEVTIGALSDY
jgi:hypothetical protein